MKSKYIKELIKIVEDSNIAELDVTKWWGNKVSIRKVANTKSIPIQSSGATPLSPQAEQILVASPQKEAEELTGEIASKAATTDNLIEIKSPMVGTFYRAPAPNAAPYVEVGDTISPGKVLCIIEAMKLMNEIEAEVSGKIVEILLENAHPVEYNQVLFKVQKV